MPVERLHLVPARVVKNEIDLLAFPLLNLLGHRVEELLEDQAVAVGNDQAHELSRPGRNGAHDIGTEMSAIVTNARTRSSFHPLLARAWIAFGAGLIAKEDFRVGVLQERVEPLHKGFPLLFPFFGLRWQGERPRDAPGEVVLVEIANQGSVGEVEPLLFA